MRSFWLTGMVLAVLSSAYGQALQTEKEQKEEKKDDEAVIRLDPNDPTLNAWKQIRDTANDPKREPGPIHIQRFAGAMGWTGIPTFFMLPVALTPEDLKAGKVDVAILGAPLDMGTGMRGAAFGPKTLRASEKYLGWGTYSDPHLHVMVDWTKELNVVDYGDTPIDLLSTERSMEPIREMVREVAKTGTIPFIVGGDHSLEYPNVAGVADVYGKEKVGVIHFDAHYDAGQSFMGHLISHGQPIRRLIEEGHVLGKNYIQVGLRGYWPGEEGFQWMREQGFRYHTMAEIERDGWDAVMGRVLEEANDGPEHLYISLDIDVLDPAFTPGTGTPEPGGLTTRELFPLLRRLCAENNLVGFDLVEFNPLVDPGYTTALNANRLLRECLTGVAMRKKGITEKGYLSPLTREHGRPKPR
jgi:formimidoylglutamase